MSISRLLKIVYTIILIVTNNIMNQTILEMKWSLQIMF